MLHGHLDNAHSFLPLLTKLPDSYRYLALDLPGHGLSDHRPKTNNSSILSWYTVILLSETT